MIGGMGNSKPLAYQPPVQQSQFQQQEAVVEEEKTLDNLFNFIPPATQRYIVEWYKKSKKGCVLGNNEYNLTTLSTDHDNGFPGCKAMGNFPLIYDEYKKNTYYFQLKIEIDHDKKSGPPMPGSPVVKNGIKMSIGFCRDNLDLNKNAIIENKKKEFYVLDLFDGESYSSFVPGVYDKYIPDQSQFEEGDIVGAQIDLENGHI